MLLLKVFGAFADFLSRPTLSCTEKLRGGGGEVLGEMLLNTVDGPVLECFVSYYNIC